MQADWLWSARRKFLHDELGLDESEVTVGTKRPVVAFYGPSQVGKTGVILRLLGMREESHAVAEHVLRGGRTEGNSATVTALRYGRSSGPHWEIPQLNWASGRYEEQTLHCDSAGAKAEFARLREFLTSPVHGSFLPANPLWVGIPSDLFEADADPDDVPVLVDLPGEGAATPGEDNHVPSLVRKWLAAASTVVVVLRLGNHLKMRDLLFGGAEPNGWVHWPGDLALALTYAISGESVGLDIQPGMQLEHFRRLLCDGERLTEEMCHGVAAEFRPSAMRRIQEMPMFPLEFGRSLGDLRQAYPDKHEAVLPALTRAMDELRDHTRLMANAESSLLATTGVRLAVQARHAAIVAARKGELDEAERNLSALTSRLATLRSELEQLDCDIIDAASKFDVAVAEASTLQDQLKAGLKEAVDSLIGGWGKQYGEWSPATMCRHALELNSSVRQRARQLVREHTTHFTDAAWDRWDGLVRATATQGFSEHYYDGWYGFKSTRQADWLRLRINAETMASLLLTAAGDRAKKVLSQMRGRVAADKAPLVEEQESKMAAVRSSETKIEAAGRERVAKRAALMAAETTAGRANDEASKQDPFLRRARPAFSDEVTLKRALATRRRKEGLELRTDVAFDRHAGLVSWTCAVMKMERIEHARRSKDA
jgi:hypothetical protein